MRLMTNQVLVLILSCLPFSAWAWSPLGATWPTLPVPYEINQSSSRELGAQATVNVIQASYLSWTSPSCSAYRVQYRGTTSNTWTSGDGVNTHIWIYSSNQRPPELGGRETIGVTLSLYRGDDLVDGDIIYNGIDHQWTTRATSAGEVDAQSIITHEVGHQLGLGHSTISAATMYASYGGGEGPRSLHPDDVEAVCTLYPSDAMSECAVASDCGAEQECVRGQCVSIASGEGEIGDDCSFAPCAEDLICVQAQDDSAFCTRICSDGLCPGGWGCYTVNSSNGEINLCLPDQDAQGSLGFGESCESGPDCTSGLCVSDGQRNFCSQSCTQDDDCPSRAECAGLSNGGGACIAQEEDQELTEFGTPCTRSSDCSNGLCLDDDTEVYCTVTCEDDQDCPRGAACFNAGDVSVCAKVESRSEEMGGEEMGGEEMGGSEMQGGEIGENDQAGREMSAILGYGDTCEGASMCMDQLCLSDGVQQFCSSYCSSAADCPNGDECVDIGNDEGACLPGSAEEMVDVGNNDEVDVTEDDFYDEGPRIEDNIGCASHSSQPLSEALFYLLALIAVIRVRSRVRFKARELPSV